METEKTKIDVFNGTMSMEFDEEVVNFKINDDDFPSDKVYVNYLGTSSTLSKDCCEFSKVSVKEIFVDGKLSNISEELEKGNIGEKKGN